MYGQWVEERFGQYSQSASEGWIWIHAVSLGETRAAAILLKSLRAQIPSMKLLLSHGTATGREEGTKLLQAGDVQVWQPWDSRASTQRFFTHFKPRIGILMETEVWPNLCAVAREAGVPLALANARLSEKSLRQARRVTALSEPAFTAFATVLAQTQDDAQRLSQAGARQISVVGNLKFDVDIEPSLQQLGRRLKAHSNTRPVLMLASSREGEEAQFLEQIRMIAGIESSQDATELIVNPSSSRIQYLIVPRHPQRFDEVQRLCEQAGYTVSRRSSWQDHPQPADIWLGDSLGEMGMYYSLADLALLGGSFEPLGGQNLIEAITYGCPVIMGAHTFNFQEASATAERSGAAVRVASMEDALHKASQVFGNVSQRQALQDAGVQWLAASQGSAAKQAQAIAGVLSATRARQT
jgi:3-deoxy-D-manno-octulosonic-acid transferase